jgi:tetratricopeptide (TPR) repeat protein
MTQRARLIVIVFGVFLLVWTIFQQVYEVSALVLLGILMLVWSYFRQGTVMLAAKAFQQKDFHKAETLLNEIKEPDYLSKSRRGFYEFIYGNVELNKNNYEEAERHFQIASRFPLRNENDKGIILVQLANLNLRKKEFDKARTYIEKAKTLKISARVHNIIEKIEKEIPK